MGKVIAWLAFFVFGVALFTVASIGFDVRPDVSELVLVCIYTFVFDLLWDSTVTRD